ncbi:MAG: DUF11 domain-containing protein, partial [Xanthomonadales bacterium]|nr:DUF11 domain-containing protein [Xanthomonadales bacterium]
MILLVGGADLSHAVSSPAGSRSGVSDPRPPQAEAPARAVTLSEGFDNVFSGPEGNPPGPGGVCTLNLSGWFAKNNSSPLGSTCAYQGFASVFTAQAGADNAYVAMNFNSTNNIGTISTWLLTPPLNFNSGAELRFWSRRGVTTSVFPDRLEIRLSTSAASTNVGTLATDVGDFGTVLGTINPSLVTGSSCITPAAAPGSGGYPDTWCEYRLTNANGIPTSGSGRIAFRYFVTDGGPDGANSNYIGIDTVSYDEGTSAGADLSITKTDGSATEVPGTAVTYTIVASNAGPNPVTGATVADTFPASITGVSWTCVGAGGGTCTASGSGNINDSVNLPVGGSVTFTAT